MNFENTSKYKMLALSLMFDAIGFITFIDIIWAPVSAYLMTKMYKGQIGKIAGTISFIEEIIPGLDIIPTFTITWFYVHVMRSKAKETIIEV
ncbi:MAG: hypothetical protein DA407_08025 [Bacteroidetes bacterium]|nr:MAG: hypothetical protein DA407_08025 [Bacteroidota bacterium]